MPGGSSIEVPPLATPASCQAVPCSGLSTVKPIVPPLAWVAGLPSSGLVIISRPPLCA
jgi:hypothetical protein